MAKERLRDGKMTTRDMRAHEGRRIAIGATLKRRRRRDDDGSARSCFTTRVRMTGDGIVKIESNDVVEYPSPNPWLHRSDECQRAGGI